LEWSLSKVIRVESGEVGLSVTDANAVAEVLGIERGGRLDHLLGIARKSRGQSWWSKHHDSIPRSFGQYLALEAAAATVSTYHPSVIPAQLQTPAYTRDLLGPRLGRDRAALIASLNTERRERLLHEAATGSLSCVIDEAALLRHIGNPIDMREQLDLLQETSHHPRVNIVVLPMQFGAHFSTLGGFTLLGFHDDPDLLYMEQVACSVKSGGDDATLLSQYRACFTTISNGAMKDLDVAAMLVEL
jgi:hypothetical protein